MYERKLKRYCEKKSFYQVRKTEDYKMIYLILISLFSTFICFKIFKDYRVSGYELKFLFRLQALWTVDDSESKIGHGKNWYICKRQDIVTHRIS